MSCVKDILKNEKFNLETNQLDNNIHVEEIFACDLLSMVMAKANEGDILITVIANVNTLAVAKLLDLSCVIFSSGIKPSEEVIAKANAENILVITTLLNTAEAIRAIDKTLSGE